MESDIKSHNQGDICVIIPTSQIFSDKKSCVRLLWQEKLDHARVRMDSGTSSLCGFGVLNWIAKERWNPLKN